MEFFGTINAVYVLLGSLILGASGGLIGSFAVLKKQGLLGDALAHACLPGIAVAFLIMQTKFLPGLLLGALCSALIGAFLITFLVNHSKIKMDTAMASILSVFFGVGILLLTYIQKLPLASQSGLDTFLFGQAAALLRSDVVFMFWLFAIILFVVTLFWKELKLFIFDSEFTKVLGFKRAYLEFIFMTVFVLAILMSLQAVGVVLTAAIFITPAVSALFWSNNLFKVTILSTFFGALGGSSGAYFSSVYANMPTGPVIVLFLTSIFLISFLFAPKKGFLHKALVARKNSHKIQIENVLARIYRDYERGIESLTIEDYKKYAYKMKVLSFLKKRAFVEIEKGEIRLSKLGMKKAKAIIEKHRLWETFLVNQLDLAPDHVHRDAEEMEHILTDEMVVKLKKILKNPKKDPHGKPIK